MNATELHRIVVDYARDGIRLRALYRRDSEASDRVASPGPGTKARRREVAALARAGLEEVLAALLESGEAPTSVGEAGFETREDVLFLPSGSNKRSPNICSPHREKGDQCR